MIRLLKLALCALCLWSSTAKAIADAYPSNPVRIITLFSVGSGPDIVARAVAEQLSKIWGQAVIIDSRSGANGVLAINALRAAAPDGLTLGLLDNSALTINPHLYSSSQLPTDALTGLSLWLDTPFYLFVSASGNLNSLKEVIAYAKRNPGKISYGTPTGIGHATHLGMEAFKSLTGTDIVLVPYKSSQPMMSDLSGGILQLAWASEGSAKSMIQLGKIKPIAVGTKTRQAARPEVPTLAEAGGPAELQISSWIGLFAPKGLPKEIAEKISSDCSQVLAMPEISNRIVALGNQPLAGNAEKMTEMLRADYARNGKLITSLKIKVE